MSLFFSLSFKLTLVGFKCVSVSEGPIKVAAYLFRPEPPPNLPTSQITSEQTHYAHT